MKTYHVGGLNPVRRYSTLEAALNQAADDDTIELHKDIKESVTVMNNIIIEGNGHTLTVGMGKTRIGLDCRETAVIRNLHIMTDSRSNGIVFRKGGTLERVTTRINGPVRVLYPTVIVKMGSVKLADCTIIQYASEKGTSTDLDGCRLWDYYMGSTYIGSMEHASSMYGKVMAKDSELVCCSFHGDTVLKNCLIGPFNRNSGNMTMIRCRIAPRKYALPVREAEEPVDGPLSRRDGNARFAMEQIGGSLLLERYVSEIPDGFVGIRMTDGSLTVRDTRNGDIHGRHQVFGGTVSFVDTVDHAYYKIRKAAISNVRSDIRASVAVKTAMEKLNGLVGLASVKKSVRSILNTVARNRAVADKDYGFSYHMVFAGDPGTGKTTVAKIVAQALFEVGAIPENKCTGVSVDRLVKGYVGQTAENVRKILDEALGGVLFIDEAYELAVPDGQNSFNSEALSVLIRYMEDHRDNLVVIAAGYEKEMRDFLASNIGLARRFQWVPFEDYSVGEMVEIFEQVRRSYKESYVNPSVADLLPECFMRLCSVYRSRPDCHGRTTNGGNGGLVRNLFQQVVIARNNRIADHPETAPGLVASDIREGFEVELEKALNV